MNNTNTVSCYLKTVQLIFTSLLSGSKVKLLKSDLKKASKKRSSYNKTSITTKADNFALALPPVKFEHDITKHTITIVGANKSMSINM